MAGGIPVRPVEHEFDLAWLIALIHDIHDYPPPDRWLTDEAVRAAALIAITAFTQILDAGEQERILAVTAPLQQRSPFKWATSEEAAARLQGLGIRVAWGEGADQPEEQARALSVAEELPRDRPYCFQYKGQTICVWIHKTHGTTHA